MAQTAAATSTPFLWEGTDRKGNKIKGKSMAGDEAQVRAELRRQGVVPSKIRKLPYLSLFECRRQGPEKDQEPARLLYLPGRSQPRRSLVPLSELQQYWQG